jgi:hypothetical protein
MIILIYGRIMSPKHCWNNYTLEQALKIWSNFDNRIPKDAEAWWGNRKLTTKQFLISNMAWNTKINLMIKGEGGDPGNKERRIQAWKEFDHIEKSYVMYNRLNKWNRDNIFVNRDRPVILRGESIRINFGIDARNLTEDKERLALVTKECLDIIKSIEKKIDYVNIMKYKDEKEKNEWEYYQFGKNEYQADLFFIRNVDRIKLIFNVIKKQKPDYTRKRCHIAKRVMTVKTKLSITKEEVPDMMPVIYEKKKRWKKMKRYINRYVPDTLKIENAKGLKWRRKNQLKNEGCEVTSLAVADYYNFVYNSCLNEYLEAAFNEDYG